MVLWYPIKLLLSYCYADSCGTALLAGLGVVVMQRWSSGNPEICLSGSALSRSKTANDVWPSAGESTSYTCKISSSSYLSQLSSLSCGPCPLFEPYFCLELQLAIACTAVFGTSSFPYVRNVRANRRKYSVLKKQL
jgi:hypothetical protein